MIHRSVGAGLRACMMASLIAMPAMLVPGTEADTTQIIALLSLIAGTLVFFEYNSACPSLIDFRNAPPVNRVRFGAVFLAVFVMSSLQSGQGGAVAAFVAQIGSMLDVPASPVRLLVASMSNGMPLAWLEDVRLLAGAAYAVSLASVIVFFLVVRVLDWPLNNGAFNVLTNLPLFDPTSGGDVLRRMKRDAALNVVLGFSLPFLVPVMMSAMPDTMDFGALLAPQNLIWAICLWAFVPSSLFIRGIALWRVSILIEEKRRRAYAQQDVEGESWQVA